MFKSKRSLWYKCLNEPDRDYWPSIFVTILIAVVIMLNIVEIIFSSMNDFSVYMGGAVIYVSYCFAIFFTLEYILRIWVSAEISSEKSISVWAKRWKYIRSPMGLVDLLSSLPLIIWLFLPTEQFADLRILKLISMIRVFKLTRYSSSLNLLFRVFLENKHTLFAAALVMMILMIIASAGIYMFERNVQPDDFGSIPSSMWWAFVTLTTVGYGDVTPITLGGKIFGSVVMVCGVGIAAMPAGIFASSFVSLVREQERERRIKTRYRRPVSLSLTHDADHHPLPLHMTKSEQNEVNYLVDEYGLTLEQAVGVVSHFRHNN